MTSRRRELNPIMAMATRAARLAALSAAIVAGAASCGSDDTPAISLLVAANWIEDPATVEEIGYRVDVDFGWPSRAQTCFPLPADLTVTLNDRDAVPDRRGDCEWDLLVSFKGVVPDAPITVRVQSRNHLWGEATYEGLFPGFGARLATPTDGMVRPGDPIVVTVPAATMPATTSFAAHFYWLDPAPAVPAFYTFAPGALAADSQSVTVVAPALTGRAALALRGVFATTFITAQSCSGFSSCSGWPDNATLGPVSVEVGPGTSP